MTSDQVMDKAQRVVMALLSDVGSPAQEKVQEAVKLAVLTLRLQDEGLELDEDRLVRRVQELRSVFVSHATSLEDSKGHIEWLPERTDKIKWKFWERYREYLLHSEQLPPESVRPLDSVTDQILERLEDPERSGRWDRRGLVVGQVQSGKTANYTGLICKAVDAGYRLIIVLAGSHNSLRSQTQLRLDHGFLGFDTQKRRLFAETNVRLGVGLESGDLLAVNSLTNSANNGDFKTSVASHANVHVGGSDPVLLVVKKNASILKNLIPWATSILGQLDPETGRTVVRGVPLLVIDDEADNASINTKAVPRKVAPYPHSRPR